MARFHVLTGAPGSGKSTVLPFLAEHQLVAADIDEVLDLDGSLVGLPIASELAPPADDPIWPAYGRLWARVLTMLLRGGAPVVFLCPLTPEEWTQIATSFPNLPTATWARLDCTESERRNRLAARGWDDGQIGDALRDAEQLRQLVPQAFSSSGRAPAAVARDLAEWVAQAPGPGSASESGASSGPGSAP